MKGTEELHHQVHLQLVVSTRNVEYLENRAPPKSELPANVTVGDRRRGLNKFTDTGNKGNVGGSLTAVYYIESHDRPTVIRRFLQENPQLVEVRDKIGFQPLVGSHGNSWLIASKSSGFRSSKPVTAGTVSIRPDGRVGTWGEIGR